jgi:hypothetical protein
MKQFGSIDLSGSGSLKGVKELILSTNPAPSAIEGRLYYNTTSKIFYGRTNTGDVPLGGGPDSGHIQNTDSGTDSNSFTIDTDSSSPTYVSLVFKYNYRRVMARS